MQLLAGLRIFPCTLKLRWAARKSASSTFNTRHVEFGELPTDLASIRIGDDEDVAWLGIQMATTLGTRFECDQLVMKKSET